MSHIKRFGASIPPLAIALALAGSPSLAQGLDAEGAIDSIVGSDVNTEEESAEGAADRIIAAIEATPQNSERVRRAFNLDSVEIIFVPELSDQGGPIGEALEDNREALEELRQSIEGSAMFYHAVDSRRIMLRDIVGLEFGEDNSDVTIFVSGTAPAQ